MTAMERTRFALLPLLLALAMASCASNDPQAGISASGRPTGAEEDCSMIQITKSHDPYSAAVQAGMLEAQAEIGGSLDFLSPATDGIDGQIEVLRTASEQGACAIGIAALDPGAVAPILDAAKAAGVKIVAWDTDVSTESRCLFVNPAASATLGLTPFRALATALNRLGQWAIVSAEDGAARQDAAISAIENLLEADQYYSDMELVETAYADDDAHKSYDAVVSLISEFPELVGILALTPVALEASVTATKDLGVADRIVVSGLGDPGTQAGLLTDGDVPAYVLWSPRDLGYLTFYATKALAEGGVGCDEGAVFDAGRLGEMKVGPNGEILLGNAITFTAGNVDDYAKDFAPPAL